MGSRTCGTCGRCRSTRFHCAYRGLTGGRSGQRGFASCASDGRASVCAEGISTSHVNAVRGAVIRLVEFCERAGWPLDESTCLTRELFDAFLDEVRGTDWGVKYKRQTACGVKQLFEESHDFGWIRLRSPRVYLPESCPQTAAACRATLPAEIVKRLNEPGALELLGVGERAAVLVLMDCGLRATDTARLRADALITGSDGAPYLRYWNHKRRREAIVPISDRAAEAIATHRAWVERALSRLRVVVPAAECQRPWPAADGLPVHHRHAAPLV